MSYLDAKGPIGQTTPNIGPLPKVASFREEDCIDSEEEPIHTISENNREVFKSLEDKMDEANQKFNDICKMHAEQKDQLAKHNAILDELVKLYEMLKTKSLLADELIQVELNIEEATILVNLFKGSIKQTQKTIDRLNLKEQYPATQQHVAPTIPKRLLYDILSLKKKAKRGFESFKKDLKNLF